jgi:hypothetical protein
MGEREIFLFTDSPEHRFTDSGLLSLPKDLGDLVVNVMFIKRFL